MKEAVIDISRLARLRVPRISQRTALRALLIVAALATLWDGFYQVGPDEAGVVLRFGAYSRTTGPGLRLKLPFGEAVTKVPVQRQLRQEFGFRTDPVTAIRATGAFADEATMLTGDLNVALVEWIVQYRVSDPYAYLYKVRDTEPLFADMSEAAMRQAVGDRTVTEVVTVGREDIETAVQTQLQQQVDRYQMGIGIQHVVLQNVNPPAAVKPSWDEVNQAEQQRDRLINEARTAYNQAIPRARGEAAQAVLSAEGYAADRVNRAAGEAGRFRQLLEAYQKAPDVTRRRLYLETMARVLTRVGSKVVVDRNAKSVVRDVVGDEPFLALTGLKRIAPVPAAASTKGGAQ
jgi:modulator of FtsH protease HflK